jgi:hypothetical protein
MPVITLPDGSQKRFDDSVSVAQVAAAIGPGLAKAALAGKADGVLVDTSALIDHDVALSIVTDRDPEGLEIIRHSTAHLLANAVQDLYPDAQVTIGPVIEDGFYYDFAYKRPFSSDDLAAIEKRMAEIAAKDLPVRRRVMPRDAAVEHFKKIGEHYKAEIIAAIPSNEPISLYGQGDWEDLCRGPHVPSTGKLKAFKLMKVAGAYWRGDSRNEMLQRIYGTAWANEKQLKEYLTRLEEAEKRDHRRIGKELDLFHLQEEAPGAVFWHPKGWALFQQLIAYMRGRQTDAGYLEVNTPEIMDRELWVRSGHVETFGENMFMTQTPDERVFAIKPMNCPGHIQVFKQGLRSYRELPLRLAEFGKVHRYEPSGALHGLMRVRAFTQDDILHAGPAHLRSGEDHRTHPEHLRGLRIYRRANQVLGPSAEASGIRRGVGQGGGCAAQGLSGGWNRNHVEPRRRGLLRAEAGIRAARCDRPRLAVRNAASGLQYAGAIRRDLRGRRRPEAHAGYAAPRHVRFAGAVYRHFAGTPCGKTADLACSGANRGHGNYQRAG